MKKLIGITFLIGILLCSVSGASAAILEHQQLPSYGPDDPSIPLNPGDAYAFSSETQLKTQVADDFPLESGLPIVGVTWWGSYWDSSPFYPYPVSDNFGDPAPGYPEIAGFNINFYAAGGPPEPWGHPGGNAAQNIFIPFDQANELKAYEIPRTSTYGPVTQTVYQYQADITTPVNLAPGIYWLCIQAVNHDPAAEPVQWGWQESWRWWNDNAVQMGAAPTDSDANWWHLRAGEDMAFEIHVVPVPTTLLLLGSGLIGLIGFRRRFR
jgi:hypothetical protein